MAIKFPAAVAYHSLEQEKLSHEPSRQPLPYANGLLAQYCAFNDKVQGTRGKVAAAAAAQPASDSQTFSERHLQSAGRKRRDTRHTQG